MYPAGVVGMIGTANDGPIGTAVTVTSYREFLEYFGPEEAGFTLHKEVKKAFLNGVFKSLPQGLEGIIVILLQQY